MIYFITLVSIIFSVTLLIDSYRLSEPKINVEGFKGVKGLHFADKENFYSKLRFSTKNNTIVLLVDSLDTLAFEKTLELYPELENFFDGFWLFRENLGAGGLTTLAVPEILLGKTLATSHMTHDFLQDALIGKNSMAGSAFINGKKVFVDFLWYSIAGDGNFYDMKYLKNDKSYDNFIDITIFRFLPYIAKYFFENSFNVRILYNDTKISNNSSYNLNFLPDNDINKRQFNKIISSLNKKYGDHVFLFAYFFGTHPPFIKENFIESTREFIKDFGHFLHELKKHSIFDNSTIILLSDHGLLEKSHDHRYLYPERQGKYSTYYFPLLIIKTSESKGKIHIRNDLMSSIYVKHLLDDFYVKGSTNDVMLQFLSNLPQYRYVYDYDGMLRATGTFSTLVLEKDDK